MMTIVMVLVLYGNYKVRRRRSRAVREERRKGDTLHPRLVMLMVMISLMMMMDNN